MAYAGLLDFMAKYSKAGIREGMFIAEYASVRDFFRGNRKITPESLEEIMPKIIAELIRSLPKVKERIYGRWAA